MERLDHPQMYLPELWAAHARWRPNREAIVCGDRRLTWGEFNRGMNRVANGLRAMGLGRGDKVAMVMGNGIETALVMFGIVKAGCCLVALSTLLSREQLAVMLDDSDAAVVFADTAWRDPVAAIRPQLAKIRSDGFFAVGAPADGWRGFEAWSAAQADTDPAVDYAMEDAFNITYSSGTTGLPKGIVQSHRARHHFAYSNAVELRFSDNARALVTTGLYSNGTWLMLMPAMFAGATLVVMERFEPEAFLRLVEAERCTHTFMVPTQFIITMAHADFDRYDNSSLRIMLCAGSPLRLDTKEKIAARFKGGLFELYGLTEGAATMIKPEETRAKFGSVGTPVLGFDIRIIDEEGRELPRGETGEIVGYGPGLMQEYYRKPKETADAVWRDERGRSYIRTGDIGRMDEDGYLYILDRKKDMIISGGFNIFPTDIEAVFGRHEDVSDVTVIGVPHEKWGETPLALVIPRTGAEITPDTLKTWANERLGKHQRVAAVEFRDDFPRNALGKVLKRLLREPYWREGR